MVTVDHKGNGIKTVIHTNNNNNNIQEIILE